jgi:hypothetical protein
MTVIITSLLLRPQVRLRPAGCHHLRHHAHHPHLCQQPVSGAGQHAINDIHQQECLSAPAVHDDLGSYLHTQMVVVDE